MVSEKGLRDKDFEQDARYGTRGQLRMSWIKRKGAYKDINRDDYSSKGSLRRKLKTSRKG
jgi:hypothetical protein